MPTPYEALAAARAALDEAEVEYGRSELVREAFFAAACAIDDAMTIAQADTSTFDILHFCREPREPHDVVAHFTKNLTKDASETIEKQVRKHIRELIDSGELVCGLDWKLVTK